MLGQSPPPAPGGGGLCALHPEENMKITHDDRGPLPGLWCEIRDPNPAYS